MLSVTLSDPGMCTLWNVALSRGYHFIHQEREKEEEGEVASAQSSVVYLILYIITNRLTISLIFVESTV